LGTDSVPQNARARDEVALPVPFFYNGFGVLVRAAARSTVGIKKGDESFCPPGSIGRPMDHVAADIHRLQQLRAVSEADLARTVADLYDYTNFAHPFREGNGRSTREFFDLPLSERGAGLDWEKSSLTELHSACHAARAESDLKGLVAMFADILDTEPAYDF
jgi:cell filamentation protein